MFLRKLEFVLSAAAGLVVVVVGLFRGAELTWVLWQLLISLAVFYILGAILRIYLQSRVFPVIIEDEDIEMSFDNEELEILNEELAAKAAADDAAFDDGLDVKAEEEEFAGV